MNEVIFGTYEGFLLGYTLSPEGEISKLKQTFATHSHTGSVRCIATAGKFLASGGTDDKIVVIDLKLRKEHTVLMQHDGTVNTVCFTNGGTHLLSGSDDGSLIVTRTGNWQVEKIWKKAHGGQAVTTIAVHPSDKLALSIGGDKTLKTWNLVKGRPAFTINLSSKGLTMATEIKFAPTGDRFSLISDNIVDIWNLTKAGVDKRITCNSKPSTVQWIDKGSLFVGLENGNIIMLTIANTEASTCSAHKQRVKCMYYKDDVLYSASSSGELKLWAVSKSNTLSQISSVSAGCRITCLSLNQVNSKIKVESDNDAVESLELETIDKSEDEGNESDNVVVELSKKIIIDKSSGFVVTSYNDNEETDEPPLKKRNKNPKQRKSKKIKK